ncbi:hypothetical protein L2E82_36551 [Cichorium intybus]|uniref:Uncharacterized protein n=1 Tax=Cichorium intybus TaxID=13427 RepID=A0ACB9AE18_CICIN|nr:hypothetical protein L2E82_36551 [Cichorium intybus]
MLQRSRRDGGPCRDAKPSTRHHQPLDRETTKNNTFIDESSRRDQKQRDQKQTRRKARHTNEDALTRQKAHRPPAKHPRDATEDPVATRSLCSATINKKLTSCHSCAEKPYTTPYPFKHQYIKITPQGEPIRAYFKRFNEATLNVPGQNDNLVTGAFTHGLLPGPLSTKFLGKPPATRQEMKERVERFLRQEEGTAAKEVYLKAAATSSSKTRENHSQYLGDRRQPFRRGKHQKPYNNHYRDDRRYKRTDILVVAEKNKQARRTSERPRDQPKYCEFHKCYGHDMAECAVLKKELDQRIQRGNLHDIAKSIRPKNGRSDTPAKNMDKPEGWNGDDPLIIQARVRDIIIHRVHIDSGSAADIMFEHCFRQLPREWRADLRPPAGNLTGFIGHSIIPTGMIYLPITIDDGQRKKTVTLEFTVVRAPSEHNIILGRPAALYFGIVASTVHGIIKFPTGADVATVLATPQKTLKCYQIMLPADIDGKRKRPRDA